MKLLSAAATLLATALLTTTAWATPNVVASIKPVHSLVSAVMAGIGEPVLIVKGAASPHNYSLRPSDASALEAADLVFWTGHGLEMFLADALDDARCQGRGGRTGRGSGHYPATHPRRRRLRRA